MTEEKLQEIEKEIGHVASPPAAVMARELIAEVRRLQRDKALLVELLPTLTGVESECPGCSSHRVIRDDEPHTDDCKVVAALTAVAAR